MDHPPSGGFRTIPFPTICFRTLQESRPHQLGLERNESALPPRPDASQEQSGSFPRTNGSLRPGPGHAHAPLHRGRGHGDRRKIGRPPRRGGGHRNEHPSGSGSGDLSLSRTDRSEQRRPDPRTREPGDDPVVHLHEVARFGLHGSEALSGLQGSPRRRVPSFLADDTSRNPPPVMLLTALLDRRSEEFVGKSLLSPGAGT